MTSAVMARKIVAKERNHLVEKHEAVAHTEIEAIRDAGRGFENRDLREATLSSISKTARSGRA